MIRLILLCLFVFSLSTKTQAQRDDEVVDVKEFAWGVKGGLTMGFQQWNRGSRETLLAYHGIAFIESVSEGDEFSVFAQAGYHVKGSAVRYRFRNINGTVSNQRRDRYEFHNLSLTAGGKQRFMLGEDLRYYYLFGIRGDYTLRTNLEDYEELNQRNNTLFYPDNAFVQKWNFGVTIGGGLEFPFTELMFGILEFTFNPDFSKQYRQPPISNVYSPVSMQNVNLSSLEITNRTFEITLGIRFIRRVEYIDTVY